MIFITGAAGKTGQAILQSLAARDIPTRALIRSEAQAESIKLIKGIDFVIGDLRQPESYKSAMATCDSVYYICPNISPDELNIGKSLIDIAKQYGYRRFIYHSVLHPQVEEMPHHWQKMRMEEALFKSGLGFTILQPCAYMQNILAGWKKIIEDGKYITPYQVDARISMVDLQDVGEVAAKIIAENNHSNAIYELAGPQALSQADVARYISEAFGKSVEAVEQNRADWRINAGQNGMNENSIRVLLQMFEYYDKFGFTGNANTLESLLGRKPNTFSQFLNRILTNGEEA